MNPLVWREHRLRNALHTLLLLGAMALVLGGLGWVLAGASGVAWALAGTGLLAALAPGLAPELVMRLAGARPVDPRAAGELSGWIAALAERAGLARAPELHYVPSRTPNAFAVGTPERSSIAVTDGLLRLLSPRELVGVLAHEISHVRRGDMRILGLASLFDRVTSGFASLGQLLLVLNLPLLLLSGAGVSWGAILVLLAAPLLSGLLHLALARTREYDADLGAVELTGDPRGLAVALQKLEHAQEGLLRRLLLPTRRAPESDLLRTHPGTRERVRRLLALEPPARRPGAPLLGTARGLGLGLTS